MVLAGLIGLAVLATSVPLGDYALRLVEWIRGSGAAGMLVYALVYIVATVGLLPGSVLTLGAGFAYGPIVGTALVSPASVMGATLACLLGRSLARGWIARKVAGNAKFRAIDQAIGESGFKIVLLLRLSPVFPFNLLNYGLGLTAVRLRDYVLASFLGMLPGTFLYVYLGSLVTSASELLSGKRADAGWGGQAVYWGGLAATVLVTVFVTRIARRALARQIGARESSSAKVVTPNETTVKS
ncbi:MAG: TVP38/TMEM64 family protein [Acidobacteria bacterium]|nr:TVP38/TMEM64 family protein [Acidobacteriota bacterium]